MTYVLGCTDLHTFLNKIIKLVSCWYSWSQQRNSCDRTQNIQSNDWMTNLACRFNKSIRQWWRCAKMIWFQTTAVDCLFIGCRSRAVHISLRDEGRAAHRVGTATSRDRAGEGETERRTWEWTAWSGGARSAGSACGCRSQGPTDPLLQTHAAAESTATHRARVSALLGSAEEALT